MVPTSCVSRQGTEECKSYGFCASCLLTRREFKSSGFYASFFLISKKAVLKLRCLSSCVCQLGRSLKVAVSMHRVFVNKEAANVVSLRQVVINKEAV